MPSHPPYKGRSYLGYKIEDPVFQKFPEALLISKSRTIQELLRNSRLIYNFEPDTEERHRCVDAYNMRLSKLWHPTETDYDIVRNRRVMNLQSLT